ncbi:MAG: HD domain-containing protein [Planctomycetota bacterium]|nr:HD domain-containing protein [Planctomycetota bacterium]
MLRVSVKQARAGMVLAMPVFAAGDHWGAAQDAALLNSGVELDERTIDRLREMGVGSVWVRYPSLEGLAKFADEGVFRACAQVASALSTALDPASARATARLEFGAYKRAIGSLLRKLHKAPHAAVFLGQMNDARTPMARHAGNVCLLSVLMGLKLDFYLIRERPKVAAHTAMDVSNLGLAAMLHDAGILRLEDHVLERQRARVDGPDEDDPDWREHVRLGYELLRGEIEPSAAAAVLQHHQRVDGSGYPQTVPASATNPARGMLGNEIHVFARIIAAADVFDRLRHGARAEIDAGPGELRVVRPAVAACKRMLEGAEAAGLDPIVVRGLIAAAPPFGPGTLVRLSDGREAAVCDWDLKDPCRPVVQIVPDLERGARALKTPRPERVDLRDRRDVTIIEAEGFDVRGELFAPKRLGEFDLDAMSRAAMNAAAESAVSPEIRAMLRAG